MRKFTASSVLLASAVAVATGALVLSGVLLATRHSGDAGNSSKLVSSQQATTPSVSVNNSSNAGGGSTPSNPPSDSASAMSNDERAKYLEMLLNKIGDGIDPEENLLKIGELGPAAAPAVDQLIRYAGVSQNPWTVYIALARIGEPGGKIAEFLMNEVEQGMAQGEETPLAFASLALLGPKAKAVGPRIQRIYDTTYAHYQIDHAKVRADRDGITDGEDGDTNSARNYDAALALIAVDPQNPSAPSAVSRIVIGDPRSDWRNGQSVFAQILMSEVNAPDKRDFYYGVALFKAISTIKDDARLSRQLSSSLIGGARGDTVLVEVDTPAAREIIAADRQERDRKADEKDRKLREKIAAEQQSIWGGNSSPIVHYPDPEPFAPFDPLGKNQPRFSTELSQTTLERMQEIARLRGVSSRSFICWSLRGACWSKVTKEETDADGAIRSIEANDLRRENPAQAEAQDRATNPWSFMHTAKSSDQLDVVAECLGFLKSDDSAVIQFLTEALSTSNAKISVRARAALALGRLGPNAKGAVGSLAQAKQNDPSPTVRSVAQWALTKISG